MRGAGLSKRIGRPPKDDIPLSENREAQRAAWRAAYTRHRNKIPAKICVMDFETNPFDGESQIVPFCCEIYCPEFSIVIWEENHEKFIEAVIRALEGLPDSARWTVYAHNGGKFDFMLLVRKLRGKISFKGRAIMAARIGKIELRDSMHILPAPLANYRKKKFDYRKLEKDVRTLHRLEILDYLHSDCVYLYELVDHFVSRHGLKLSIGQAALGLLKNHYDIESLGEASDGFIRDWFFGGRVECLQGPGHFIGDYVLEDVNSMYPDRMAYCEHPIGADFSVRSKGVPRPNKYTCFLEIFCDNFGALVGRDPDGNLTPNIPRGLFKTTIWEFEAALELNLIRNVTIKTCIDFHKRSAFPLFSLPLYAERQHLKDLIDKGGEIDEHERELLVTKFLLNNGYGKLCQNPRNFREFYYSDFREKPPGAKVGPMQYEDSDGGIWELEASVEDDFAVWKKPVQTRRYNNVATGASITGAARAKLLRKLATAISPIYCDTDCVISLNPATVNSNELGAWKTEQRATEILIAGKKLYAVRHPDKKDKIRSKGGAGLSWNEMQFMLTGGTVRKTPRAPTIFKTGHQEYQPRNFSATCPKGYRSRIFEA